MKYIVLKLTFLSFYSFKKLEYLYIKSGLDLGFDRINSCLFDIILEVLLQNTHTHHPNSSSEMKIVR